MRFKLEHADSFSGRQQLERWTIIKLNGTNIKVLRDVFALTHQIDGLNNHRQGLKPQEVKLHQPGVFNILHVELCDRHVRARITIERHELIKIAVTDHNPGRVGRGVAVQPFDLHGDGEQAVDVGVFTRNPAQVRFHIDRFFERDRFGRVTGNHFTDFIDIAIRDAQHTPDVTHGGLGLQLTERDDLCNAVMTVFFLHILNHFATSILTEIDVKVGHRHTFRVKETFEQKREPKRIKIGNQKRIGHKRPCPRPTARPNRDFMILGPLNEIGNDQEVTRKTHLIDDAKLILKTRPIGFGRFFLIRVRHVRGIDVFFQPALKALFGHMAQFVDLGAAFAAIKGRQDRINFFDVP